VSNNPITYQLRDYADEPLNRQRRQRLLEIADDVDEMFEAMTDKAWHEGYECGKEEADGHVLADAGGDRMPVPGGAGLRVERQPLALGTCSDCLNWHSYDGEWGGCSSFLNGGTGSSCAARYDHSCGEWVGDVPEPTSEYEAGWRDGYERCRQEMTDTCDEMVRTARREAGLDG